MDTKLYTVDISVLLKPILTPTGKIGINNNFSDIVLSEETWFHFHHSGTKENKVTLQIEHYGKSIRDADTAIIIDQIKLNGISNPKFAWQGTYYPAYPEHYSQGKELESELRPFTHMGWNGVWTLEFSLPIYTWIHKTLDLGWIYD